MRLSKKNALRKKPQSRDGKHHLSHARNENGPPLPNEPPLRGVADVLTEYSYQLSYSCEVRHRCGLLGNVKLSLANQILYGSFAYQHGSYHIQIGQFVWCVLNRSHIIAWY